MQVTEVPEVLRGMKEVAAQSENARLLYMIVGALIIFGIGFFFMMRHVLLHTREIHAEANKTNNENSKLFQETIQHLTTTFSNECRSIREMSHRNQLAARDMVHVARDLAQGCVSQKEVMSEWQKREDEQRKLEEVRSQE
jgi:hypothetical protein